MPTLRERIYAALGFKVRRRDRLLKKIIEKAERSEIHKSSIGRPLEPIFPSPVSKKLIALVAQRLLIITELEPDINLDKSALLSDNFPNLSHQVSSTKYPASSIQHRVTSIEHPVSSIQYRASSIEYPVSSIKHPVPSTSNPQ